MGDIKKLLLLATGQEAINKEIVKRGEFKVVGVVERREELERNIRDTNPSVVLVGEGLPGYGFLPHELLDYAGRFPNTRIIYLAGEVSLEDERKIEPIKSLARAGIYDIIHSGQIKKKELFHLLNVPMSKEDVSHLFDEPVLPVGVFVNEPEDMEVEYKEIPTSLESLFKHEDVKTDDKNIEEYEQADAKVIVFSSIKPGTGKSFLAVNVATAIAQYGIDNINGKRPRVALIEADLQNLSIGTLLKVDDHDSHLLKAMDIIEKLMNSKGDLIVSEDTIQDANAALLKCFIPYDRVRNLEILAGSQARFKDAQKISSYYYSYLISALKSHFDYIIVDSNSSIAHTTTFPILKAADTCYYILNLDYNNIRNNIRYQADLIEWEIMDKVHYILNEDLTPNKEGEKLDFGKSELEELGFKLEAAVPLIDKSIFNNRIYQGTPITLDSDKKTHDARYQILKIANGIHTIMNFSDSNGEELLKKKKMGFRR